MHIARRNAMLATLPVASQLAAAAAPRLPPRPLLSMPPPLRSRRPLLSSATLQRRQAASSARRHHHHHRQSTTVCRAQRRGGSGSGSDDEDEDDDQDDAAAADDSSNGGTTTAANATKPVRIERLLANLGYGNRRECSTLIKRGRVTLASTGAPLRIADKARAADVLLDGEPLDPPPPLVVALHKPCGYVVTSPDDTRVVDPTVYDLLPPRLARRKPLLAAVGRLDKETSGLLLLTDDGQLLHRIKSPSKRIWKRYVATLDAPLSGKDAAAAARRFASGTMTLAGDRAPLLPAALMVGQQQQQQQGGGDGTVVELAIAEGRYHQVRRMMSAVGREVVELHRRAIGGLELGVGGGGGGDGDGGGGGGEGGGGDGGDGASSGRLTLEEGQWRFIGDAELSRVFGGAEPSMLPGSGGDGGGGAGGVVGGGGVRGVGAVDRRRPKSDEADEEEDGAGDELEDPAAAAEVSAARRRFREGVRRRQRRAALRRDVARVMDQEGE